MSSVKTPRCGGWATMLKVARRMITSLRMARSIRGASCSFVGTVVRLWDARVTQQLHERDFREMPLVVDRARERFIDRRAWIRGDVHRQSIVLMAMQKRARIVERAEADAFADGVARAAGDDERRDMIGRIKTRQMRDQRSEASGSIGARFPREKARPEFSDLEDERLQMRIERDVVREQGIRVDDLRAV